MGASVSLVGYGFGACFLRFVLFFGGGWGGRDGSGCFQLRIHFLFAFKALVEV